MADGSTEARTLKVNLDVRAGATTEDVITSYFESVDSGTAKVFMFPTYATIRGFVITKITEKAPEGAYKDVPREEMNKRLDSRVKFRLRADAVMHDGRTRDDEYAGSAYANSPSEAKLEVWRKILDNDAPWCDTASEVESVTFRVQRFYQEADKVIYERSTPKVSTTGVIPEGYELELDKLKLTGAQRAEQGEVKNRAGETIMLYRANDEGEVEKFCGLCDAYHLD